MPLTEKGRKIMRSMSKQYGPEKAKKVFYASKNKGTIRGVDKSYAKGTVPDIGASRGKKEKGGRVAKRFHGLFG